MVGEVNLVHLIGVLTQLLLALTPFVLALTGLLNVCHKFWYYRRQAVERAVRVTRRLGE